MSNSLWALGREVLCVPSHTKELVDAPIVGPSDEGDDYIVLRYIRGGRNFTNSAALRHTVQFHVRFPSRCRCLSPSLCRYIISIWVILFPCACMHMQGNRQSKASINILLIA